MSHKTRGCHKMGWRHQVFFVEQGQAIVQVKYGDGDKSA